MASPQSLIPTNFYDQPRRRRFYWLTPVIVLILYLCVIGVFIWLQHLQHDSVMFVTLEQEMRQQRLLMVVVALSCVIVVSLLFLWRYARIRSRAEAALMAETRFRRAMEKGRTRRVPEWHGAGKICSLRHEDRTRLKPVPSPFSCRHVTIFVRL